MSRGKDFFLWFNSTIAFAIGVLAISRAFLVKLLRLCTIYHSLTCVMFQILVQKGYSWRQLSLCWAAIKDNISYLSKKGTWQEDWNYKSAVICSPVPSYSDILIWYNTEKFRGAVIRMYPTINPEKKQVYLFVYSLVRDTPHDAPFRSKYDYLEYNTFFMEYGCDPDRTQVITC